MTSKKLVAIKYDKKFPAPYILFKAKGKLADKVKEMATDLKIPIEINSHLATGLFSFPVDSFIPEEYFEIMAKLLSVVYKTSKDMRNDHS